MWGRIPERRANQEDERRRGLHDHQRIAREIAADDTPAGVLKAAEGRARIAERGQQAETARGRYALDGSTIEVQPGTDAMLDQARETGTDLDLRLGDMRQLVLEEPAALIYCPFRSLLHLPTWADRRRTFERVAASLKPGGRFAWNFFVFDPRIAARCMPTWRGRSSPSRAEKAEAASVSIR